MGRRVDIGFSGSASSAQLNGGAGTIYIVQTPAGVLYCMYNDGGGDLVFRKSTDGGLTWSLTTTIFAGTLISLSVWYDRWSDIAAGLIHLAYTEQAGADTLYRTIDTENSDALSTQTTIFAGTSAAVSGSFLTICRARGGNVYCRTQIDAGVEGGFYRLPNANVPNGAWDAARTINEAAATLDMMILLPGWAADNQDMMAIFWDASANEISRQLYDDSANSWSETSISGSMVEISAPTAFPNFAAAVDIANSQNILVAWNGIDTANQDLLGWTVTESAITAFGTTPVLNGTDDQGLCGITIDVVTGYWYVIYAGKSDGSETWTAALNLYYKVSTDSGATWGPEIKLTNTTHRLSGIYVVPRLFYGNIIVKLMTICNTSIEYRFNVELLHQKATYQLGI